MLEEACEETMGKEGGLGLSLPVEGPSAKISNLFNFESWVGHRGEVIQIKVTKFTKRILITLGEDKNLKIWKLDDKIGDPQNPEHLCCHLNLSTMNKVKWEIDGLAY